MQHQLAIFLLPQFHDHVTAQVSNAAEAAWFRPLCWLWWRFTTLTDVIWLPDFGSRPFAWSSCKHITGYSSSADFHSVRQTAAQDFSCHANCPFHSQRITRVEPRKGGQEGEESCTSRRHTAHSLLLPASSATLTHQALARHPRNPHWAPGRFLRSAHSAPGSPRRARGCPTEHAGSPWAEGSHQHHRWQPGRSVVLLRLLFLSSSVPAG